MSFKHWSEDVGIHGSEDLHLHKCTYVTKQEGFLRCQTLTSAVRLEVEGCRVKNGGWRIESEEWRV